MTKKEEKNLYNEQDASCCKKFITTLFKLANNSLLQK